MAGKSETLKWWDGIVGTRTGRFAKEDLMGLEFRDDDRLRDPEADEDYIRAAMKLIEDELRRATAKFGRFASPHEGIAIIEEEFLELREAVFWGHKNDGDPGEEAIQLGAMAARFLVDLVIPHVEAEALKGAETRA